MGIWRQWRHRATGCLTSHLSVSDSVVKLPMALIHKFRRRRRMNKRRVVEGEEAGEEDEEESYTFPCPGMWLKIVLFPSCKLHKIHVLGALFPETLHTSRGIATWHFWHFLPLAALTGLPRRLQRNLEPRRSSN